MLTHGSTVKMHQQNAAHAAGPSVATMRLRGLDDFLGQVKQLYKDEDSLEDGV